MLASANTFTSFSAKDINEIKEFYSDKLGLKIMWEMEGGAVRFATGGDTSFTVYFKEDHEPAKYTVLNFEVSDLESEVKTLIEEGIKMEQYPEMETNELGISTKGAAKMAWFTDPAGNIVGLMESDN